MMASNSQGIKPPPGLRTALRSSDSTTLKDAADELRRTRNSSELALLHDALHQQTNDEIRKNAVIIVGLLGDTRFLPDLYITLNDPEELTVGRETVRVLRQFRNRNSVPELCRPLLYAREPALRRYVAETLGRIGSSEALPFLFKVLDPQEERSAAVRIAAASALGSIGKPQAVSVLSKATLSDGDRSVRSAAIQALGQIGNREARFALLKALLVRDVSLQNEAGATFGMPPYPELLADVVRMIDASIIAGLRHVLQHSKNEGVLCITAHTLGMVEDPSAIPELCNALEAEYESVREEASIALLSIGSICESALRSALDFKMGGGVSKRREAARILGQMNSHTTIRDLAKAFSRDPDNSVRKSAIRSLKRVDPQKARELLAQQGNLWERLFW